MFKQSSAQSRKFYFALLASVALVAVTVHTSFASATTKPSLTASADCRGRVTFSSSSTESVANVDVLYSLNGEAGPFTSVRSATNASQFAFTTDNKNKFGGNFGLPSKASKATVKVVSGDAETTVDVNVPPNCGQPAALITAPTCDQPRTQVELSNVGVDAINYNFYKNASTKPFASYSVAGSHKVIKVTTNEAFQLTVATEGMTDVVRQVAPAADCGGASSAAQSPTTSTTAASDPTTTTTAVVNGVVVASVASSVCAGNGAGWTLTLDNSSETRDQTFVVTDDKGKTIDSVDVAAGIKTIKTYAFTQATGTKLNVAVNGVILVTTATAESCVSVDASISAACESPAGQGVLLGFTNTGKFDETFTVVRDGKPVEGSPFTLAPSRMISWKLLPLNENQSANIQVTGSHGYQTQKTVTLDCLTPAAESGSSTPPSVLATSQTRNGLADTGIVIGPTMMLGIVLVGMGLVLLRASGNLSVMNVLLSAKSEASGFYIDRFSFRETWTVRTQEWLNTLLGPKGQHVRRR